mmetsp:Transcript_6020/g.7840  ORF Transcript_6020/g.7840 Transcript_6020/m.7840 type:complete len:96 (-) Transcript_6020:243-530(-)
MTKMVSNVTFTIAEGKMEEFATYLDSIKDDVKSWDGMDSFAFAKASETSVIAWAVYADLAAMEANAGKFKAALGGAASTFGGPPGRVIAEILIQE